MYLFARKSLRLALSAPLFGLWIVASCALQGEGERCDNPNSGDADCSGSLVCVKGSDLRDPSVDRCCPPQGQSITDNRCLPSTGIGGSGGAAGAAGSTGTGGSAGAAGSIATGGAAGASGTGGAGGAAGTDAGADAATD